METSSATPTPAQRTSALDSAAPLQRKARATENEATAEGTASVAGFSQLLQAAALPGGKDAVSLDAATAVPDLGIALPASMLPLPFPSSSQLMPDAAADAGMLDDTNALALVAGDVAWTVQSLVGQTAQLDQSGDVALRNGTHVQARLDAGDPLGMMRSAAKTALGAATQLPVVAQGVAAATTLAGGAGAVAAQVDTGVAAWNAASDTAQAAVDVMADGLLGDGDALSRSDRSSEGRVSLQGQWVAADRQAPPAEAMQRLLGQMSQFLSATGATDAAGLRRSGSKASDDGVSAGQDGTVAASGVGVGAGTGRLLDNAVAQTAAGQQAGGGDAQGAQAEPDMAFWMNSRQQRAEMVLDREGEPVRVQVTMEGNTAHVTFRSDEQATRAMLDASVAQLRDLLASQGVELAGVQVGAQASGGQQGDGAAAQDRFMPEGARRVRLPSDAAALPAQGLQRAGGASRQGVDIFA